MPTYEREIRVRAPFEDVWNFHSRPSGLEILTPNWMGLRIESIERGDREADHPDATLEAGTEITTALRPFGLGPTVRWTSRIVAREVREGTAYFRDEMIDGPFDRWVHAHAFYADGDDTVVRDLVEYDLPVGPLETALEPLSRIGFEAMFRHRHRKTRRVLEGRDRG